MSLGQGPAHGPCYVLVEFACLYVLSACVAAIIAERFPNGGLIVVVGMVPERPGNQHVIISY